jgi:hypothetical protein
MDENLRIGMVGLEPVSGGLEFDAKLPMIIDFPIEYDPNPAVLIAHRLIAALKVDDRQPTKAERYVPIIPVSLPVRAAVSNGICHSPSAFRSVRKVPEVKQSSDAAHYFT